MKYCTKCLQPNTRVNIVFTDGVCGGCVYEESKSKVNWKKRKSELDKIVSKAKTKSIKNDTYDSVIGVSGGKDSHFQALYAKEVLGLNSLLVCNAPDGRTDVGTHNIENLRSFGFDLLK